jgi:hypothetical protein
MTRLRGYGRRQPALVPASGAKFRIGGLSLDGNCDGAASRSVTHHFIVKPVQNLP